MCYVMSPEVRNYNIFEVPDPSPYIQLVEQLAGKPRGGKSCGIVIVVSGQLFADNYSPDS